MGGDPTRRAQIRHELDSYISKRKKGPRGITSLFSASPSKPAPHAPSRPPASSSPPSLRLSSIRSPGSSSGTPSPAFASNTIRDTHRPSTLHRNIASGARSHWEGLKSIIKETVIQDLSRINPHGGTTMKPSNEFMDFEEGGLTVVPIPDEPEHQSAKPASSPQPVLQSHPAPPSSPPSTPAPASSAQRQPGWFSRFFSKKKAVKQEQLLDEDFLLSTPAVQTPLPEVEQGLKNDFKELAKLFLKTLERMNKDQLSHYKSTPEFERLKDLLRKHQVIK